LLSYSSKNGNIYIGSRRSSALTFPFVKMIVEKDFLNKLKDFGLNTYESKLWTALLSRGISTAGELSDIANVPRSRSYDVLESLERKGFVMVKPGKPIKYAAIPPVEVLERVKKKIQDNTSSQIKLINEMKSSHLLDELNHLHVQGIELVEPTELIGSLRGRDNLYNHLESMVRNAKKSVVLLTTPGGLARKSDLLLRHFDKNKSKISVKIAISSSKEIPGYKPMGKIAEVRQTDIKARLCLVDGEEILLMLLNDEKVHPNYDVGVWMKAPFFVSSLQALFEKEWLRMKLL